MTGDADRVGSESLGLRPSLERGADGDATSAVEPEPDDSIRSNSGGDSSGREGVIVRGVRSLPRGLLVIAAAMTALAVAEWLVPGDVNYAGAVIGLALMVVGYRSIRGSGGA